MLFYVKKEFKFWIKLWEKKQKNLEKVSMIWHENLTQLGQGQTVSYIMNVSIISSNSLSGSTEKKLSSLFQK